MMNREEAWSRNGFFPLSCSMIKSTYANGRKIKDDTLTNTISSLVQGAKRFMCGTMVRDF